MKPLSVLEALVLERTGWRDEEQRRLYNKACEVLHAAAVEVRDAHREYPERAAPVTWVPASPDYCKHGVHRTLQCSACCDHANWVPAQDENHNIGLCCGACGTFKFLRPA